MKKIIYSLVIMIAAGSLFTSCIDPVEPQGLADLREAKADYLAALSGLRAADAKVQEAQAAFILAQAEVQKALAAQEQAAADYQKLLNERQKAQNDEEKARIDAQIKKYQEEAAIASANNAKWLAQAQAALADALKEIEANAMLLTTAERKVVNQATTDYQWWMAQYVAAYDNYQKSVDQLYASAYEGKDWEAEYTNQLADAKENLDFWSEVLAQFESMDNEPAQWKAALEQYNNEILALEYAKLKLDEEAALQYTDARTAFEELRVYAQDVVDSVGMLEPGLMSAKVDFPVDNYKKNGVAYQFAYLAYPISHDFDNEFFVGMNSNDRNFGFMGFANAHVEDVRAILYGGALDASQWGEWLTRNSSAVDGEDFIGLVDLVETLKRDSVVSASTFGADYEKAKAEFDSLKALYDADYALLKDIAGDPVNKFKPLMDSLDAVKTALKLTNEFEEPLKEAQKNIYTVAGNEIARVYKASDELTAVINKIQAKFAPVNWNQVSFFVSGNAYLPAYMPMAWSSPYLNISGSDALNYSMSKEDSTALINAIVNLAKVKEEVFKDTAKIDVFNPYNHTYGPERVSQLQPEGFKQYLCTSPVHNLNTHSDMDYKGIYCYSLYGGNGFLEASGAAHDHGYYYAPYMNEYPCYAVNTGSDSRPSWSYLPVQPYDDAFVRAITAVSGYALPDFSAIISAIRNNREIPSAISWEKYDDEGGFNWSRPVGYDDYEFNFLSYTQILSGYSNSYRLVDNDGNFMIDELIDTWFDDSGNAQIAEILFELEIIEEATGDATIKKELASQLIKDLVVSLLDIDYLKTFFNNDLSSIVKTIAEALGADDELEHYQEQYDEYSKIVDDFNKGGFDSWVSGGATYVEYEDDDVCIEELVSYLTYWGPILGQYNSMIANLLREATFKDAAVVEAVNDFFEIRDKFDARFDAITNEYKAFNAKVNGVQTAVDSINKVYNRFWGNEVVASNSNSPVEVTFSNEGAVDKPNYNRLNWKNISAIKVEKDYPKVNDWKQINWSWDTWTKPDDIIIPTFDRENVMNFNEKLALVLTNLTDGGANNYENYYSNPEASYIISGNAGYTELVEVFFAKYTADYLASYEENEEALEMIAEGVAALEAAYIEANEAAQDKWDAYFDKLAEVTGADEDGDYLEYVWEEINNIADGEYHWVSGDASGDANYTYGAFLDRVGYSPLGTGTFAAAANEIIGSYLADKAEREYLEWAYQGKINDLNGLINGLTNTYNDILLMASNLVSGNAAGVSGDAKYADNYKKVFDYINNVVVSYQNAADAAQKALDQLAAGYDPNMIKIEKSMNELAFLKEQLEMAKAELEKAKATYEAVIAKYLN